jgi:hypothetical protein
VQIDIPCLGHNASTTRPLGQQPVAVLVVLELAQVELAQRALREPRISQYAYLDFCMYEYLLILFHIFWHLQKRLIYPQYFNDESHFDNPDAARDSELKRAASVSEKASRVRNIFFSYFLFIS